MNKPCAHASCTCTVGAEATYCSRHCEEHAGHAHGCKCGHPDCKG